MRAQVWSILAGWSQAFGRIGDCRSECTSRAGVPISCHVARSGGECVSPRLMHQINFIHMKVGPHNMNICFTQDTMANRWRNCSPQPSPLGAHQDGLLREGCKALSRCCVARQVELQRSVPDTQGGGNVPSAFLLEVIGGVESGFGSASFGSGQQLWGHARCLHLVLASIASRRENATETS